MALLHQEKTPPSNWEIYMNTMSRAGFGTALWNPAPYGDRLRADIGDVGFIQNGCFVFLFNATEELGKRELGTDVPFGFVPLEFDKKYASKYSRPAGPFAFALQNDSGWKAGLSGAVPHVQSSLGVEFNFKSGTASAAILMTKKETFREDAVRILFFKQYIKHHHKAWLALALKQGYDVKVEDLILVTGVDLTADFSMLAIRHAQEDIKVKFETTVGSASVSASGWGSWECSSTPHTNWGRQLENRDLVSQPSGKLLQSQYPPPEFTECVFFRGYRVHYRAHLFPSVMVAGAGPHDVGSGSRSNEDVPRVLASGIDYHETLPPISSLEELPNDNNAPLPKDKFQVVGGSSYHDPLDYIAEYIFKNSDATMAVVHDDDWGSLRLAEFKPEVVVDSDGAVGEIAIKNSVGSVSTVMPESLGSPSTAQSSRDAPSKSPASNQSLLGSSSHVDRSYPAPASHPERTGNSPSGSGYGMLTIPSPSERSSSSRGKPPPSLIAVMGATGSGKSTFINLVSNSNLRVGGGSTPYTKKVETSNECIIDGQSVVLIDTPGFDYNGYMGEETLHEIEDFLSTFEGEGVLDGIIFFHRISDSIMGGIAPRNFHWLEKLCGDDTFGKTIIVTNMWDLVDLDVGRSREKAIASDPNFFKPALDRGALMFAHDSTYHSAVDILQFLLERGQSNRPRKTQKELVSEHKNITDTTADVELEKKLAEPSKHYKEGLNKLRDAAELFPKLGF